jgi:hypothetical protein
MPAEHTIKGSAQATLRRSTDPKALVHAAQILATSDDADDLRALGDALIDAGFLARLDDDVAYEGGRSSRLRVGRVLRTLCRRPDALRAALVIRLIGNEVFLQQDLRTHLLIKACASLRPPPPEAIAFWEVHCLPEDGFCNLTIAAVIENGSVPALELFVKNLLDPAHAETDKLEWLRQEVLSNRHDLRLLHACGEALARGLGPPLDLALVQVLFDHRPGDWYRPATLRQPPDRAAMPPDVAEALLVIAAEAQAHVALDERTARILRDFVRRS